MRGDRRSGAPTRRLPGPAHRLALSGDQYNSIASRASTWARSPLSATQEDERVLQPAHQRTVGEAGARPAPRSPGRHARPAPRCPHDGRLHPLGRSSLWRWRVHRRATTPPPGTATARSARADRRQRRAAGLQRDLEVASRLLIGQAVCRLPSRPHRIAGCLVEIAGTGSRKKWWASSSRCDGRSVR